MKLVVLVFAVFLCVNEICALKKTVERYLDEINDFIKNTEDFRYPVDSREFLKGQNEEDLRECRHAGEFDFIVVGAGSSGSVLANRLSEVGGWRILLLEAGGHETDVSDIPAMADYLTKSRFNWGYRSTPQKNSLLSYINQTELIPRGKALGGSSVLNFMMYVRGNREDYNLWSSLGNPGWSYGDVLRYFKKSEHTHIYDPDPGYHGFKGNLNTENVNILSPLTYAYLLANEELGRDVLFDYNGRTQKGFAVAQTTTKHGRRNSAAKAFLEPIKWRPNLKILSNTLVVKLLIRDNIVYGVQYINNGTLYCIEATMEVILSAGAINTPQLLMLSGIGPKEQLQEHNISSIKDLPGVGQNLWDHIFHFLQPFTTNYTTKDISQKEAVRRYLDGKGYLTTAVYNQDIGFVNLFSSDKSRPDVEHIFCMSKTPNVSYEYFKQKQFSEDIYNYITKPLIGNTTWNSVTVLLHPKSRGTVRLKSNSPFDFPLIDPNYFSDPNNDDLNTLIAAMKDVIKISKTESLQRYNSRLLQINLPGCKNFPFESDEYFGCLIKNLASTISHFSGTCKMGPKVDPQAVVDNELKVYGLKNLRIVDCSVIPVTLSGHTQAAACMIGEKAADLIKEKYGVLDYCDDETC